MLNDNVVNKKKKGNLGNSECSEWPDFVQPSSL